MKGAYILILVPIHRDTASVMLMVSNSRIHSTTFIFQLQLQEIPLIIANFSDDSVVPESWMEAEVKHQGTEKTRAIIELIMSFCLQGTVIPEWDRVQM